MRRLFVVTLILTVTVFAGSSDARTRRVSLPDPMDAIVQVATYQAVAGQQYVAQLQAEQYVEMIVEYLASVPVVAPSVSRPQVAPVAGSAGGGGSSGGHSDAWWQGVAMCEQGGRNDPYFGYFSWMDGSQGGRSWDEQVAASNDLLARAGREIGPWAAACVAAGYRAASW